MEKKAASYTGIYGMHKYWSKKPFNLVRNLILKYSKENDIVLDPFCGSGISAIEAVLSNRKAIGIDINPMAIFITRESLIKINSDKIESEFKSLQKKCESKINDLYKVKRDDHVFTGTHFLWSNGSLDEIWYSDEKKKKVITNPNQKDVELANSFSYEKIPFYLPKAKFFHNSRINAKSNMHVYDLFTPRNAFALSFLLSKIKKINDLELKNLFKFCFTASLGQASKMVFVINKRGKFNENQQKIDRKELGSWVIGYWIPKENFEVNVWNCFRNRYKRILKAKKEKENSNYKMIIIDSFQKFRNGNLLLLHDSAQNSLKNIPDNSVDYVITDPPHGNRLPYLELSLMWNAWLGKKVNYDDEIVISEAKERKKNHQNYNTLLGETLHQIERVLKVDRHFTLIFNSLDDKTWSNLQSILKNLRIKLEDIGTMSYSANSVVQDNRKRGLKTDFVLTFKKVSHKPVRTEPKENYNIEDVNLLIDNLLKETPNAETYQILNSVVSNSFRQNKFFKLSHVIEIIDSKMTKVKSVKIKAK